MKRQIYKDEHTSVYVMNSEQLQGLAGDNGERFCLFIHYPMYPLQSGWRWFHTEKEAEDFWWQIYKEHQESFKRVISPDTHL